MEQDLCCYSDHPRHCPRGKMTQKSLEGLCSHVDVLIYLLALLHLLVFSLPLFVCYSESCLVSEPVSLIRVGVSPNLRPLGAEL